MKEDNVTVITGKYLCKTNAKHWKRRAEVVAKQLGRTAKGSEALGEEMRRAMLREVRVGTKGIVGDLAVCALATVQWWIIGMGVLVHNDPRDVKVTKPKRIRLMGVTYEKKHPSGMWEATTTHDNQVVTARGDTKQGARGALRFKLERTNLP